MEDAGLVTVPSSHSLAETIERLLAAISAAGLTVFALIDHAAGAADVGLTLRPTQLVIFGNPRGGTPLMQDQQTSGIDLPVKMLVWSDEAGKVRLTYNDSHWIARRHHLAVSTGPAVDAIAHGLAHLASQAAD